MDEYECLNCGNPTEDTYELLLRNTNHQDVPLCEECFDAINDQLDVEP